MSSVLLTGAPFFPMLVQIDNAYLQTVFGATGQVYDHQNLPGDVLGTAVLTLTNVQVGSRYRIERAGDGSLATPTANAEGAAGAASVPLTLDYYAPGSPNNSLRVKVRKGTAAPYYLPFETLATVAGASQSIYVSQIPDE